MGFSHGDFKMAIHRSQHCQRNWDLSKDVTQEDLDLFITAVSQCPSKQNVAFYRAHFVTRRALIEKIHSHTDGFVTNLETGSSVTNSQVLANLLVIFEEIEPRFEEGVDRMRSTQTLSFASGNASSEDLESLKRDRQMAVGIAAGYLNLTASLMGYATGCCLCFDGDKIREAIGGERSVLLLMGIGFKNPQVGRRLHHLDHSFMFPTKAKQDVPIQIIR